MPSLSGVTGTTLPLTLANFVFHHTLGWPRVNHSPLPTLGVAQWELRLEAEHPGGAAPPLLLRFP
jgi:hypothetical protein